ncbi:MAG: pilin [Candidatus Pacebacteria bacterium]|nr:pilin [Candidatus Paceibacterota bacterium]
MMKKFFIFFILLFFIFLFFQQAKAEGEKCIPCPCGGYYYCAGGCEGELRYVTPGEPCCGGSECEDILVQECQSWERCSASPPSCSCQGECLETPSGDRYYDNPYYSDQSSKSVDKNNIKLPVKLDWNDVAGWGESTGPKSYVINIYNKIVSKIINKSEYDVQEDNGSCLLDSNSSYNWDVSACCNANGTNCGNSSNWNLKTSLAPELVSPKDPDWQGEESAQNTSVPVKLDWCSVNDAESYFLKLYKDGKIFFPVPIDEKENIESSEIEYGTDIFTKLSDYSWEIAACLNADGTDCGEKCKENQEGSECGDFSQYWKINTGTLNLLAPVINFPKDSDTVNLSNSISWESMGLKGVLSYRYEILKNGLTIISATTSGEITSVPFSDIWNKLELNQGYTLKLSSCWDEKGNNCEQIFNNLTFKTTGAPPTNIKISPFGNQGLPLIPVSLTFDQMPAAASYYYELSSNGSFSQILSSGLLPFAGANPLADYPLLKTKTNYWLALKTCADREAKICGNSSVKNFTTFTLPQVANPEPSNGGELISYQKNLSWNPVEGANYYQYKISGGPEGIVGTNSTFLETGNLNFQNYSWSVKACLDKDCQDAGEWANFSFNLVPGDKECKKGLVPCGRNCDSPDTPYDDHRPCEFKDIFYIFRNILDFVLWTLIPILLIFLVTGSGIIYYTAMGDSGTLSKIKSIWKSFGKGFLIVFSAWFIVTFLLSLLGFQIEIFGKWWQFPI